jgi:hypothetical protein
MARVLALADAWHRQRYLDTLRAVVVCGCALALIAADRALPFLDL